MSDQIRDLTGKLKGKLITAPSSFADDVMLKIELHREGSFRSMPLASRILVSVIMIVLYCSLGILLGVKSYEGLRTEEDLSSEKALVELMESHHMNSDLLHDQLFRNLTSTN